MPFKAPQAVFWEAYLCIHSTFVFFEALLNVIVGNNRQKYLFAILAGIAGTMNEDCHAVFARDLSIDRETSIRCVFGSKIETFGFRTIGASLVL
jgi:hypothetical protein